MKNLRKTLKNLSSISDSIFALSYSNLEFDGITASLGNIDFDDTNISMLGAENESVPSTYIESDINKLKEYDIFNYFLLTDIDIKLIIKNLDILIENNKQNFIRPFMYNHQNGLIEIKIPKEISDKFLDEIDTNNVVNRNVGTLYQKCTLLNGVPLSYNTVGLNCLAVNDIDEEYDKLYKYNVYNTKDSNSFTISKDNNSYIITSEKYDNKDPVFILLSNKEIESRKVLVRYEHQLYDRLPDEYNPFIGGSMENLNILIINSCLMTIEDFIRINN